MKESIEYKNNKDFYRIEFLKVSYNKGITMAFNITFSNITQISGSYLLTSMVVDLNFS